MKWTQQRTVNTIMKWAKIYNHRSRQQKLEVFSHPEMGLLRTHKHIVVLGHYDVGHLLCILHSIDMASPILFLAVIFYCFLKICLIPLEFVQLVSYQILGNLWQNIRVSFVLVGYGWDLTSSWSKILLWSWILICPQLWIV